MTLSTLIFPANTPEKAYQIATDAFAGLWFKITGIQLNKDSDDNTLPSGDLIFIGSGVVNKQVHKLLLDGSIPDFQIKYSSDDYTIISQNNKKRNMLFIAGGCGRSTIYAVYDFFRKQTGAEYFWDGDVIPKQAGINIGNCNYIESPRFQYRGLRYFAHRGLHRFQAEHWDFTEWQQEIDWIMKKRLNFFMLRTGLDDLFQRAFPDVVPYPSELKRDPDFVDKAYDDRTSFWPLAYRGELRKKVLQYAFERGLLHPEDTGTMTHWYSRTPTSFIEKRPVSFCEQTDGFYSQKTGMVWDINKEQSWNDYWQLTQTHIDHFGQNRLFHTIGLAERSFGNNRTENLRIKKSAYRKIQHMLRISYPDAPLILASWDFAVFWKDDEVKELLNELNPDNTLILDYAADMDGKISFEDWGYYKKFPWIFGIFHAFEPETVIHGKYKQLIEKIRKAVDDSFCKGMVLWPEASHIDTLMLEFFTYAAWQPESIKLHDVITNLCHKRYFDNSLLIGNMPKVWTRLTELVADEGWDTQFMSWEKTFQFEPHFRLLNSEMFSGDLRSKYDFLQSNYNKIKKANVNSASIIKQLLKLSETGYPNLFWRRDALDIVRTLLNLKIRENILLLLLTLLETPDDINTIDICGSILLKQFELLGQLLSQHEDFSIFVSLEKLQKNRKINPYSEQTLKSNIENSYSRCHACELATHVYKQEFKVFLKGVKMSAKEQTSELPEALFKKSYSEIQDAFYNTPLSEMQLGTPRNSIVMSNILRNIVNSFKLIRKRENLICDVL